MIIDAMGKIIRAMGKTTNFQALFPGYSNPLFNTLITTISNKDLYLSKNFFYLETRKKNAKPHSRKATGYL